MNRLFWVLSFWLCINTAAWAHIYLKSYENSSRLYIRITPQKTLLKNPLTNQDTGYETPSTYYMNYKLCKLIEKTAWVDGEEISTGEFDHTTPCNDTAAGERSLSPVDAIDGAKALWNLTPSEGINVAFRIHEIAFWQEFAAKSAQAVLIGEAGVAMAARLGVQSITSHLLISSTLSSASTFGIGHFIEFKNRSKYFDMESRKDVIAVSGALPQWALRGQDDIYHKECTEEQLRDKNSEYFTGECFSIEELGVAIESLLGKIFALTADPFHPRKMYVTKDPIWFPSKVLRNGFTLYDYKSPFVQARDRITLREKKLDGKVYDAEKSAAIRVSESTIQGQVLEVDIPFSVQTPRLDIYSLSGERLWTRSYSSRPKSGTLKVLVSADFLKNGEVYFASVSNGKPGQPGKSIVSKKFIYSTLRFP